MHAFVIADAQFVTESLAVGGDLDLDIETAVVQAAEIVQAGVTHVLDVRLECDDAELWSCFPEISYRWDGIDDAGQRVPGEWFDGVVGWAVDAIRDGGVVLTHCHMGINRGPSVGYAVLLAHGWDPVEALAAIRDARPVASTAYAGDALRWHLDRSAASSEEYDDAFARVERWRDEHPVDIIRVIGLARLDEALRVHRDL